MPIYPRILPCGACALSIELGDGISDGLNEQVQALDAAVLDAGYPLLECVPTYRSALIQFDPVAVTFADASRLVLACLARAVASPPRSLRVWSVPALYGEPYGDDLAAIAELHGLSPSEVVQRHAGVRYRVFAIGFMPGFAYLGGLDPALATPRRTTPRLSIPGGSITIGGAQTALTSVEAPSGWHVIGRSPVLPFLSSREPACLFAAGDIVEFAPIHQREWPSLQRAAEFGEPVAVRLQ